MRKSNQMFTQSVSMKRKQRRKNAPIGAIIGITALAITTGVVTVKVGEWLNRGGVFINQGEAIIPLVELSPTERADKLEKMIKEAKSLNLYRARYLRGSDLISQNQGQAALKFLEGLEKDYPLLGPQILEKRAEAYDLIKEQQKATEIRTELIKKYPQSPVTAKAMFAQLKDNPQLADQLIQKFPSHPQTLQIVRERLEQNPNQLELLQHIIRYGGYKSSVVHFQNVLVKNYSAQIKSQDWQIIADNYWTHKEYAKASAAYKKAPNLPKNAYFAAKGLELTNHKGQAESEYKYVIVEFPDTAESDLALRALSNLSPGEETIKYLDDIIAKYPRQAPAALMVKAKIQADKKNPDADKTKELVLTKYGNTEAAAEYKWNMAQKQNDQQNYAESLKYAAAIIQENPESKFAPRATFWAGKWAKKLGKEKEATQYFEMAIAKYPQSYYAWRSAVFLGWDVGDFDQISKLNPQIISHEQRPILPGGTDAVKELYQIGQDEDAWTLWRAELTNKSNLSVSEQFTEGLLRLANENYLQGIDQIAKLEDRIDPKEKEQFKTLRQQSAYWYALYPFPYMNSIKTAAKKEQINPLLVISVIRQESRFESDVKSVAGATGLMQLMPDTAKWAAQQLNITDYKLITPDDNITLGTYFLDHSHNVYKQNTVFALVGYNAGSGNLSKWLAAKKYDDIDQFVEEIPFPETNWYVKNVLGNYWNYLRLYNPQIAAKVAKYTQEQPAIANR